MPPTEYYSAIKVSAHFIARASLLNNQILWDRVRLSFK